MAALDSEEDGCAQACELGQLLLVEPCLESQVGHENVGLFDRNEVGDLDAECFGDCSEGARRRPRATSLPCADGRRTDARERREFGERVRLLAPMSS